MRWLVFVLVACLALAVLKATIIALLVTFGLMILWGVLFRPAETFGFFALMCFMSILERYPLPVLLLIGLLGVLAYLQRPDNAPSSNERGPNLLTHEAPHDRTSGDP